MPEGATLVNTARKEVIDEEGLLKVFAERDDFRYLSDIAPDCREELEENYKSRVLFTPKEDGSPDCRSKFKCRSSCCKANCKFYRKGR